MPERFEDFIDEQLSLVGARIVAEYQREKSMPQAEDQRNRRSRSNPELSQSIRFSDEVAEASPPCSSAVIQKWPVGDAGTGITAPALGLTTSTGTASTATSSAIGENHNGDAAVPCEDVSKDFASLLPNQVKDSPCPPDPRTCPQLSVPEENSEVCTLDALPSVSSVSGPSKAELVKSLTSNCQPNDVTSPTLDRQSSQNTTGGWKSLSASMNLVVRTTSRAKTSCKPDGQLLEGPLKPHDAWSGPAGQGQGDEAVEEKKKLFSRGSAENIDISEIRSQMLRQHSHTCDLNMLSSRSVDSSVSLSSMPWSYRYEKGGCARAMVCDPSSPKRITWDTIGVFLIAYDMIFIPLTIFELPPSVFFKTMQWFAFSFWLIDMPASFFCGFHHNGVLVKQPSQIARKYLKTFFLLDISLVSIDLVVNILEFMHDAGASSTDPSGVARIAKTYRIVRILRGLRLIRLARLPQRYAHVIQHIQSDYVLLTIGIVRLTVCILFLNHGIACAWYGICNGKSTSWLSLDKFRDASVAYLYMSCLHWSLTQFTPASMEIFPSDVGERTFAVIVIVFALVTASSFISSITNAMTSLRNMNSDQTKNLSILQKYFRSNSISLSLSVRVRKHLDHKLLMHSQIVQEKDVALLQMLSGPLLTNLHYEVYSAVFKTHLFFERYDHMFRASMKRMCHEAVGDLHLSEGDVLFDRGQTAKSFFVLKNGQVRYRDNQNGVHTVEEEGWLAEAVLWTPWVHHGQARAKTEVALVSLESVKFQICALETCATLGNISHYAAMFIEHLNSQDLEALSDLYDSAFDLEWAADLAFIELPGTEDGARRATS